MFPWKPKYIKERVAAAFTASGGTLDYRGLQCVINEVFDCVDGEGCPTWKARAVHKLLLKGAFWVLKSMRVYYMSRHLARVLYLCYPAPSHHIGCFHRLRFDARDGNGVPPERHAFLA